MAIGQQNKMKNPPPHKAAVQLAKQKLTVREYEELQEIRLGRLKFFESKNVKVLIDNSKELYEWGEEVLKHLKGIYSQSN